MLATPATVRADRLEPTAEAASAGAPSRSRRPDDRVDTRGARPAEGHLDDPPRSRTARHRRRRRRWPSWSSGAGFPAKSVPPKQWASGLCTSLRHLVQRGDRVGADQLEGVARATSSLSLTRRPERARRLPARTWRTRPSRPDRRHLDARRAGRPPTGEDRAPHGQALRRAPTGTSKVCRTAADGRCRSRRSRWPCSQVTSIQGDVNERVRQSSPDQFQRLKRLDTDAQARQGVRSRHGLPDPVVLTGRNRTGPGTPVRC